MNINKEVSPAFYDYVFDWDYEQYIIFGGYGSGKSYETALKIILKLIKEKRICLVVREVFDTIYDSCYSLFCEILDDMNLISNNIYNIICRKSPLQILFPNGSKIIFKGLDRPEKIKSINGISVVWIEEAAEIKAAAYTELLGRLRTPDVSTHFIMTFNPVDKSNWVYKTFFINEDNPTNKKIIVDDNELYRKKIIKKGKFYYHHSIPEDNYFLPKNYLERLDDIKKYDPDLWRVAKLGEFGTNGIKVLPQFEIAKTDNEVYAAVRRLDKGSIYCGMDFGFEESFNAVITCAVDLRNKYLYIYREYYKNQMTDTQTAEDIDFQRFKKYYIIADSEDPKAIKYYQQMGYKMRGAHKIARIEQTRKIKRFRKIICAPCCKNTIRELKDLTYKKDKQGNLIYDEFNIDPHTFSAIWYALDMVTVADEKQYISNSKKGVIY